MKNEDKICGDEGLDQAIAISGVPSSSLMNQSIQQIVQVGNSVWCDSQRSFSVWNAETGYFQNTIPVGNVIFMNVLGNDVWVVLKDCAVEV